MSVADSFSGCTVRSNGSRSSKTRSSSMATEVRSCPMVSPLAMCRPLASAGATRSTNRSPNSVFGSSRADTLAGIRSTISGFSASLRVAPLPVVSIERTSPTIRPRILTSEEVCSCEPIRSVSRLTMTTEVKRFWNDATDSPTSRATTRMNPTP